MKQIHIFNPAAGSGIAGSGIKDTLPENHYLTQSVGDCRRFVAETCKEDPTTHFIVHGGDGTLNEAVSGIVEAGAGETARLTVIPAGSGNDTVKSLNAMDGDEFAIDLYECNGRYGINIINIGFDCNVAASASGFKKKYGIAGSLSYILGVFSEFFKPFGWHFKINATLADGGTFEVEDDCLLCCVCNGQWCGGGFHTCPQSDMTDGVLELLIIKKVSRLKFLTLVGKYKAGALLDPETGDVVENLAHLVTYKKITAVTVAGTPQICLDGEIVQGNVAEIKILPHAMQYQKSTAVKETV